MCTSTNVEKEHVKTQACLVNVKETSKQINNFYVMKDFLCILMNVREDTSEKCAA